MNPGNPTHPPKRRDEKLETVEDFIKRGGVVKVLPKKMENPRMHLPGTIQRQASKKSEKKA